MKYVLQNYYSVHQVKRKLPECGAHGNCLLILLKDCPCLKFLLTIIQMAALNKDQDNLNLGTQESHIMQRNKLVI